MKISKRIIGILLACTMCAPMTAFALDAENSVSLISETYTASYSRANGTPNSGTMPLEPMTAAEIAVLKNVRNVLASGERTASLDVSEYNLSADFADNIGYYLRTACPELFFIDASAMRYTHLNNIIQTLYFTGNDNNNNSFSVYRYNDEETAEKQLTIDEEAETILSHVDESMSDFEKILAVHDYIVSTYEYDTTYTSRTLDSMIEQKKGVCQGYTYLFQYIMDKLGIECIATPHDSGIQGVAGHVWNKVKFNGKWYNIDLTFDDPLQNKATSISHKYFLISDDKMIQYDEIHNSDPENVNNQDQNHSWWDENDVFGNPAPVADDTVYENSILQNMHQVAYLNGKWYGFSSENNLCEIDFEENSLTPIYTDSSTYKWHPYGNPNSSYLSTTSTIINYDGALYFNSPSEVFRFDTQTNKAERIYEYTEKPDVSNTYLYGLRIVDGALCAEYTTDINSGIEENIEICKHDKFEIPKVEPTDSGYKITIPRISSTPNFMPHAFIAEYDDNNIFICMKKISSLSEANRNCIITPTPDTTSFKIYIWGKNNMPLENYDVVSTTVNSSSDSE